MCIQPISKDGNTFACGKCTHCHKRYLQHWIFRLKHQLHYSNIGVFVTLTYDYAHIPFSKGKFTLRKSDYQNFFKRLRKALPDRSIKYVICGEYGSKNNRPHYHAIIFGLSINDFNYLQAAWSLNGVPLGTIHVGTVTEGSIAYVFKYSVKSALKVLDWRQLKPFVSMSKGLGQDFAFAITRIRVTGIDKNGNNFVRYRIIRVPKPHFARKLTTLTTMPFYRLNGYMMSVPRFYTRCVNHDMSELHEVYHELTQRRFSIMSPAKFAEYVRLSTIQRLGDRILSESSHIYSISREKL